MEDKEKGDKMTYKVFMKYYKMNVFKHLGINTLGELQEFIQYLKMKNFETVGEI